MKCRRCGGSGREPDLRAVGRTVRAAREAKGMGVREVARAVGCSAAHVSDIEHGRRNPHKGEKARLVVQEVGIDPDALTERTGGGA